MHKHPYSWLGKAGKTLAADLAKHGQQVVAGGTVSADVQQLASTSAVFPANTTVESESAGITPTKRAVFAAAMNAKNTLIPKLRAANFAKLDNLDGVTRAQRAPSFSMIARSNWTDPDGGEQTLTAERISSTPVPPRAAWA